MDCCEERYKDKPRDEKLIEDLKKRLNRISGQINGISKMVDDGRYCADILMQVSAVESALQQFGYLLLENHMETCVKDKMVAGDEEIIKETIDLMKKLK
ncbi:MAG: metal-sensing transcriptional repressor [Bacilli bacterium]|nr:metal-sensing transcriptional repressor [Bacilli bacterium]